MVQIVDSPGNKFDQFFNAFKPGLESGLGTFAENRLRGKENEALREIGHDIPKNVRNQKFREALLESSIKKQNENAKMQELKSNLSKMEKLGFLPEGTSEIADEALAKLLTQYQIGQKEEQSKNKLAEDEAEALGLDKRIRNPTVQAAVYKTNKKAETSEADRVKLDNDAKVVEKFAGKDAGEIYRLLDQGGRTEFFKRLFEANSRNEDVRGIVKQFSEQVETPSSPQQESELPQVKNGKLPQNLKLPDYTKRPEGYTPKEWIDERKEWRKENAKNFESNKEKISANKRDALGIKKLTKLNNSKKIADGFERLLINPSTGEFYGLAQLAQVVSEEAQEWVKEIARFGNRAKDAFGSRVTNFDLQQYMKQFPGLLNTKEGRERILKMMDVNNQLDALYENVSNQLFQTKGLSGMPPEEVDRLTQELIKDETERLNNEYLGLDQENEKLESNQNRKFAGPGVVIMYDPQGNELHVPERDIDKAEEMGAVFK